MKFNFIFVEYLDFFYLEKVVQGFVTMKYLKFYKTHNKC